MTGAHKTILAVALATLVLFSGCGGNLLGSGAGTSMPPGLSENGVQNASALTLAHQEVLETNSYTVTVRETNRYENGSLRGSKRVTYRVDPDTRTALKILEPELSNGLFAPPNLPSNTVKFYRNGTTVHVRGSNATTTEHVTVTEAESSLRSPKMVPPLLTGVDLQYNGTVERNGTTLHRIESTAVEDTSLVARTVLSQRRYDELLNVSFQALVTEDGLIKEYTVEYAVMKTEGYKFPDSEGEQVIRGSRTVTFESIGSTEVDRPRWVKNQSST